MKKELVGIKDMYDNWSFIFSVECTEHKNIKTVEEFISIVQQKYPDIFKYEFIQENNEIYTFINSNIIFNPGNECKI